MNKGISVYTVPELSKLLHLTPQSVRKYLQEGRIQGRKTGVRWLVSDESIRNYLHGK